MRFLYLSYKWCTMPTWFVSCAENEKYRLRGVQMKVLIIVLLAAFLGGCGDSAEDKIKQAQEDAKCAADLQCSASKFNFSAESQCGEALKEQAKIIAKWDYQIGSEKDGYSGMLEQIRWGTDKKSQIIYSGTQAKFQNGFGAWQHVPYECTFDIASNKVVDARFIGE